MSQKLKDQSLSSEVRAAALGSRTEATGGDIADFDERIRRTLNAAWEKKALDLTVLDLRGIASFTDYFVMHVFDEKARRFYDLERLWREARRVDVSPEQFGPEISSFKSEISDQPERDKP